MKNKWAAILATALLAAAPFVFAQDTGSADKSAGAVKAMKSAAKTGAKDWTRNRDRSQGHRERREDGDKGYRKGRQDRRKRYRKSSRQDWRSY